MSKWTIPVVVSDVQATLHPPATGPGYPNRNFGLIGVLSLWNDSGVYQGLMQFTKPATPGDYFAGNEYQIASQYITGTNPITITIPQAASDCQKIFKQNGTYSPSPPNPANPALFDTASVNNNGVFTAGNLSLPDFTLKGTWDTSQNTISNGEIWLPYRFLWAIWGNNPNQSQTPWAYINLSYLNGTVSSTNSTVFYSDSVAAPSWGATGIQLQPNNDGYAILGVNLSGVGLGSKQGIALNISCTASSAPLTVLISTDKFAWNEIGQYFTASVAQQCFYIAPTAIPSANPFYLKIQNPTAASVVVAAAQLMY